MRSDKGEVDMSHIFRLAAALAVFAVGLSAAAIAVGGSRHGNTAAALHVTGKSHVTICHATGSKSHPFVEISPSAAGVFHGHVRHQDARDIIPAFSFVEHGATVSFAGQNLTKIYASGQTGAQILAAHCVIGQVTTTTTTTTTPPPRSTLELLKQLSP